MKKIFLLFSLFIFLLPIISICDELHHVNGRIIVGKIIEETEEKISIYTERYGRLTYEKMEITKIIRGNTPTPPTPVPQNTIPPSPPEQQSTSPFQDGAAPTGQQPGSPFNNPFGGSPAQPQAAPQAPANPFGGSPFQSDSGSQAAPNPFGAPPSDQSSPFGAPQQQSAFGQPQYTPQPIVPEKITYSAEAGIPSGFDAMVISMIGKVSVKKLFNFEPITTVMPLKAGMEVKVEGKGYAKIILTKDRSIIIMDDSSLRLTSITNSGDSISVKLFSGSGWFFCGEKRGLISFTLSTPNVILNQSDAFHFKVTIENDLRTILDVNFGDPKLTFSKETSKQMVAHKGQSISISPTGLFSSPQMFERLRLKEWEEINTAPAAPPTIIVLATPIPQQPQFSLSQQAPAFGDQGFSPFGSGQQEPQAGGLPPNPFSGQPQQPVQQAPVGQPRQPSNPFAAQGQQPQPPTGQPQSPFNAQQPQAQPPAGQPSNPFADQPSQPQPPSGQPAPQPNPFAAQGQQPPAGQPQSPASPQQTPIQPPSEEPPRLFE